MAAGKKNFPLRLDPALYEVLERWAADELRSVNGHIEFLLREAALRAGRLPGRSAAKSAAPGADASPSSLSNPGQEEQQ